MRLVIITPIFDESVSGAAVYYRTLCGQLQRQHEIVVISERASAESLLDVPYRVLRIFPRRSGRERKRILDVLLYGIQNISYFLLPFLLYSRSESVVLVHTSFFNHPGIFGFCLKLAGLFNKRLILVADVRDVLLPQSRFRELSKFDHLIACSRRIESYLDSGCSRLPAITTIPVIQQPASFDQAQVQSLMAEYGLAQKNYWIYAGLLKEDKRVDLIMRAHLCARETEPARGTKLLLIGPDKFASHENSKLLKSSGVVHLAHVDNQLVRGLVQCAGLSISISPKESLSRITLESIDSNTPFIAPPGIPEYDGYPVFPENETSPEVLASMALEISASPPDITYDMSPHRAESVAGEYTTLLEKVATLRG
jgi:glycosyltransferase involved in cell wall biosynthesis